MPVTHARDDRFDRLRQQAEALIEPSISLDASAHGDILELINELQIHQAELEIQNEKLKRAQQELSDLHRQYEQLYEFAPCGYLTLSPKGVITRVNLAAFNLLRTPKKNLLQSTFDRYLPRDWQAPFYTARINATLTGEKQRVELQLKPQAAPPQWVRADIIADRDASGAVLQWQVVMMDITLEKSAEAEIRNLNRTLEKRVAERTAELEVRAGQLQQLALDLTRAEDRERKYLAAILHDDFQQQAAYIKMELGRLARCDDTDMGRQLAKLAQFTGDCIEKMRHLAYALNPPALLRSGLLAALNVLAKDMRTQHGLAVTLNAQANAEPNSAVLSSIAYRSVRELLFNVVKHAGVSEALVEVRNKTDWFRINVIDGGKGFDYPAIRNGHGDDAGFGLYNIEDRMLFLGGTMQILSEPGKGSRVVLTMPKTIRPHAAAPVTPSRAPDERRLKTPEPVGLTVRPDAGKKIRILLAEDYKLIRKGLVELLNRYPDLAVVGEAADGRKAIELTTRLRPDVILMDVTMPDMDGIEATACITGKHADVRIIGLSMHNDDDTRQKMLDAGAVAFLTKTDSPDKLLKTIHRVHRSAGRKKNRFDMKA